MAKVIWTEPALNDLGRIFDYLADALPCGAVVPKSPRETAASARDQSGPGARSRFAPG